MSEKFNHHASQGHHSTGNRASALIFVVSPIMIVAHLVFAALSTGYITVGARFEEHDLEKALPEYSQYKKQVPMFLPTRLHQ